MTEVSIGARWGWLYQTDAMANHSGIAENRQKTTIALRATAGIDGIFTDIDPNWRGVLGWKPHDLLDTPLVNNIHPDDLGNVVAAIHHLYNAKDRQPVTFRCRYRRKAGVYVWTVWQATLESERWQLDLVINLDAPC